MPGQEPNPPTKSRPLRHVELLIALLLLLIVQSFLSSDDRLQRALLHGMFFIVVLSAMRSLSRSRIRMWFFTGIGFVAYSLSWVGEIRPSDVLAGSISVCFIVIFSFLISALAQSVFASGPIDTERIIGAISIYLLLGLVWAFLYSFIELSSPGSFQSNSNTSIQGIHSGLVDDFIYFSQVTLTTLGYGDIAPVSRPARMFATLQAMTGQLYVAIVIARLVGLQISQDRN